MTPSSYLAYKVKNVHCLTDTALATVNASFSGFDLRGEKTTYQQKKKKEKLKAEMEKYKPQSKK